MTYQSNMTSKVFHQTFLIVEQVQRCIITVLTNKTLEWRFTRYVVFSNVILTLNKHTRKYLQCRKNTTVVFFQRCSSLYNCYDCVTYLFASPLYDHTRGTLEVSGSCSFVWEKSQTCQLCEYAYASQIQI